MVGLSFCFFFWSVAVYLKPLKNKVFSMDKELGQVKTEIGAMKGDIKIIKEVLISKK